MALSLGQKAGWGLADLGVVVFVVVKQLLILTYLTTVLGVPVGIAGLVTTGVLIFDMMTDPLVGYLSDRTQSRYGRRAPWMAVGAVVLSIGMVGIFAAPAGMTLVGNLAWVIAFFGLATVGFTLVAIPYGAQAGEITQDPKERSAMTGWRMGFASVGILTGGRDPRFGRRNGLCGSGLCGHAVDDRGGLGVTLGHAQRAAYCDSDNCGPAPHVSIGSAQ